MREHKVNELDNFICGWYMDDSSICDEIMAYHYMTPLKAPGISGSVKLKGRHEVNPHVKDSTDCVLNDNVVLYKKYTTHLNEIIKVYSEKYPMCNYYFPFSDVERINIQHYKPGQGFHAWHTERAVANGVKASRHLVFLTYLNDVTDEGETEFFHQKLKVKPEKGLTVVWPADWTFTHRGVTSPTQEKYIVTGWLNYVEIWND